MPTVAGLGIWALAAAAALAGQSLATSRNPEDARPWLIAAALLGFASVRLLEHNPTAQIECEAECPRRSLGSGQVARRRRLGSAVLLGLGGVYALVATVLSLIHI